MDALLHIVQTINEYLSNYVLIFLLIALPFLTGKRHQEYNTNKGKVAQKKEDIR